MNSLIANWESKKDRMHYACPDCQAGLADVGDLETVGAGSGLAFYFSPRCCFCGVTGDGKSSIERMLTVKPRTEGLVCIRVSELTRLPASPLTDGSVR